MNELPIPDVSEEMGSLLGQARRLLAAEQPAEALPLFQEYLAQHPNCARGHACLGIVYAKLEKHTHALRSLSRALELDPTNSRTLIWRCNVWREESESELALADVQAAVQSEPDYALAYVYLGVTHLDLGNAEEAAKAFRQVLVLTPDNAYAHYNLAKICHRRGDVEQALAHLDQALLLDGDDVAARRLRASIHQAADRLADAVLDLQEVVRRCPDDESTALLLDLMCHELEPKEMTTTTTTVAPAPHVREIVYTLLRDHFAPTPLDQLVIQSRVFPVRVRADLQRAIDELVKAFNIKRFFAPRTSHYESTGLTSLMVRPEQSPSVPIPCEYEEVDIGEESPIRCLLRGIWLFEETNVQAALHLYRDERYGHCHGTKVEIAVPQSASDVGIIERILSHLESAIREARSYRGKVLSLEHGDDYSGRSTGIKVHKLPKVTREQVILPHATVDLLERNIIGFMRRRPELSALGLSTKKGVLFFGPPGTGKTHTIAFLSTALPDVTTLLITAEQIGYLGEYMTLARLLQPSIVVIEDADLIARNRETMGSPCEEVLLNKLLNEMDGLRENAEIFFILTTNRPEALEDALANRPGRIDQAIEFPRPDADCRRKLLRLYAAKLTIDEATLQLAIERTERTSAAFLKELVRRSAQFAFEAGTTNSLTWTNMEHALGELLFKGGLLNRAILGFGDPDETNGHAS